MIAMVSTANNVAGLALSTASAQGSALCEMQNRLGLMGQLALVDFSVTQTVYLRFFAQA